MNSLFSRSIRNYFLILKKRLRINSLFPSRVCNGFLILKHRQQIMPFFSRSVDRLFLKERRLQPLPHSQEASAIHSKFSKTGLIPQSCQPSFFLEPSCFRWGSDGFLERRIPGKNGDVSPRLIPYCQGASAINSLFSRSARD